MYCQRKSKTLKMIKKCEYMLFFFYVEDKTVCAEDVFETKVVQVYRRHDDWRAKWIARFSISAVVCNNYF